MKKTFTYLSIVLIAILWIAADGISAQEDVNNKSVNKIESKREKKVKKSKDVTFFEVARLIMSKEEKEIYKHLPNKQAQFKFIDEFWEKRDPTPGTEENESRDEFYLRIAFANKYFKEYTKGRGWDTERGRILLQLGFPDKREFGDYAPTYGGRLVTTKRSRMEVWVYYRYNLVLKFIGDDDASSRMELISVPSELAGALDRVKQSLNLVSKAKIKNSFRFDVDYTKDHFNFSIPVKKVSFEEIDGNLMAVDLDIKVYVYKNNKRFDLISTSKTLKLEKEKLLDLKTLDFTIPYVVTEKGKYLFDVVIEERSTSEKFRDMTKFKI